MNITMDELSLKKVKFGAEPASSQTETETQAPVESNPEKGMNALTFMGIRNLMSNPKLAQEVGVPAEEPKSEPNADAKSYVAPYSSNIAFQGNFLKNPATKSIGALFAATALMIGASSCEKETVYMPDPTPKEVVVNVSQTVNVNFDEWANQIQLLIAYLQSRDAQQTEMWKQLLAIVTEMSKKQDDQTELLKMLDENIAFIRTMVKLANDKQDKALEMLNKIYNSNMSANEKLKMIQALLSDIKDLVAKSVQLQQKAELDRQALLAELQKSNATQSKILEYSKKSYESEQELIMQNKMILAKLEVIDVDMNSNAEALAQQLGMTFAELKELIRHIANGVDISNYQAGTIIQLLKTNNEKAEETNKKLAIIIEKLNNGSLSADELRDIANQILSLLGSIDARLADIASQLKNIYNSYPDIVAKLNAIINNQNTQTDVMNKQYQVMLEIKSMLDQGVSKEDIAVIINLLSQQNVDLDKLIRIVCALNQNVTEGRAENRQFAETVLQLINKYGSGMMDKLSIIIEKMGALENSNADLKNLIQKFFNAYLNNVEVEKAKLDAILDAIANIKVDTIDLSGFEAMLKEIKELLKTNNNWLSSIDGKMDLIRADINLVKQSVDNLAGKIPNYEQQLNQIIALMEALKNKPGYDDTAVVNKLNEITEILLTHQFCNCNCEGGNGNHEGIIGDLMNCLNS